MIIKGNEKVLEEFVRAFCCLQKFAREGRVLLLLSLSSDYSYNFF